MALLEVEAIYLGYGDSEVLHGVSVHVEAREIVTIIGPNGAGKSTLLKGIMGYLHPYRGHVRLHGEDINALRADQRVQKGVAYVPQLDNVFPSLTVEENLTMGGYLLDRKQVSERAGAQYARFPRLAERRKQRVRTMSGGERQMLAMARALMTEPELLLLDEPSAALSPRMAGEVFDKVGEIRDQGKAVVIVEQEAQRSLEISDRGYVLADGRNAFEGPAEAILQDEKIRAAYLGSG